MKAQRLGTRVVFATLAIALTGASQALAANTLEDDFQRPSQTGFGRSTNTHGVPPFSWSGDAGGTKAYNQINANTGELGFDGVRGAPNFATTGATYNGGDALARFRVSATGSLHFQLPFQACPDKSCYYGVRDNTASHVIELAKRIGGRTRVKASAPFRTTAGADYWIRGNYHASTGLLRMKIWADGAPEPRAWKLSWTEPGTRLRRNASGVASWASPSTTATVNVTCYAFSSNPAVAATGCSGTSSSSPSSPPPPPPPPPPPAAPTGTSLSPSSGAAGGAPPAPPPACTTPMLTAPMTLTRSQVAQLQGNTYHLQANEWGSSAPFSITTDGCPGFRIATSAISKAPNGGPGAYPSLYKGCHWGNCTANSGLPRTVTEVQAPGTVTTSAATTTVTTGTWSTVYDIWWDPSSTPSGGGQLEMMIWLTKLGPIQPAGALVAGNVAIGDRTYDVWKGSASPGGIVSYVLTSPSTSITNLDLGPLAADAAGRGYMAAAWSLIGVEFGFEPRQGGAGLSVDSFTICTPAGC